jgi:hypothetical protein
MSETRVALYINSADRNYAQSTSSTDFVIDLSKTIRNVTDVEVTDIVIPKTYFNINTNSNVFKYSATFFTTIKESFTVIVPPSNYTKTELAAALELSLNNTVSDNGGNPLSSVGIDSWSVTYNTISNIFTLNVLSTSFLNPGSLQITIIYTGLSNSMGIGIGNEDLIVFNSISQPLNPSPAPVEVISIQNSRFKQLQHHQYLVISSTILTRNINSSYINSSRKIIKIDSSNNLLEYDTFLYDGSGTPFIVGNASVTLGSGLYAISELAVLLNIAINESPTISATNKIFLSYDDVFIFTKGNRDFVLKASSTILNVMGFYTLPSSIITSSITGEIVDKSINNNILTKIVNQNTVDPFIVSNGINIEKRTYDPGLSFEGFDLQLRDDRDRVVDLNGEDWSCTVVCTIR